MYCKQSEIKFVEAVQTVVRNYSPIKIFYNNDLVWDGTLALNEGWCSPNNAIENFKSTHPEWEKFVVYSIKINIAEWHHSIVWLKGKTVKERYK